MHNYSNPDINPADFEADINIDSLNRNSNPAYDIMIGQGSKQKKIKLSVSDLDRLIKQMNIAYYDEFADVACCWGRPINKTDGTRLQRDLHRTTGHTFSARDCFDYLLLNAKENSKHPIKEYLASLPAFTGISRIPDLLDALSIDQSNHLAEVQLRKFFIAGIARIMQPGCKVDNMLVFRGGQGAKKSTLIKILAKGWSSNTDLDITSKDAYMQIQGNWLYEFAEVEREAKKGAGKMKAFLSSETDRYRAPFATSVERHPRSTLFIGTTNETDIINDTTGARRYWIIDIDDKINIPAVSKIVDELWAEALYRYNAGEEHWLTDEEETQNTQHNLSYQVANELMAELEPLLESSVVPLTTKMICEILGYDPIKDKMKINSTMKMLGWISIKKTINGNQQRYWEKNSNAG